MKLESSLASRPAWRAARRVVLLATLLSTASWLAACGQKGPLTLTKPALPTPATSAASAAAQK